MATLHNANSVRRIYVKGAVEVLLERCASALDVAGRTISLDAAQIHRDVDAMALRGLRVLAFARKDFAGDKIAHDDVASGLAFLGLQGIIDPPREEAIAAVLYCGNDRRNTVARDHNGGRSQIPPRIHASEKTFDGEPLGPCVSCSPEGETEQRLPFMAA